MTLPGVNVFEKGTQNGSTTDFDGNYSINVSSNKAILVFSYIGFSPKEVVANSGTKNITLDPDSNELDEVVVVGYGSVKKSDITGSVSSVKSEELTAFPVLNAGQALQGRAAGVVVQSNNGAEPGAPISIKIRGNTSISASSAALIVVDGFVGAVMPQAADIQSMEVLKDASATAIYGSRGANGVVLVTTKKGKSGKMSIELNTSYSVQNISNQLDLLNTAQSIIMIDPQYVNKKNISGKYSKSITIKNNVIKTFDSSILLAMSVDGLIFEDNRIEQTNAYPPIFPDTESLKIVNCNNVSIQRNTYRSLNGDKGTLFLDKKATAVTIDKTNPFVNVSHSK